MKLALFLLSAVLLAGCTSNPSSQSQSSQSSQSSQPAQAPKAPQVAKHNASSSDEVPDQATMDMLLSWTYMQANATGNWSAFHDMVKRYAKQGHAESENVLGVMYLDGTGVEQDSAMGIAYLEKSTAHGSSSGPFNLGVRYHTGQNGLKKDPVKAFELYKVAADRGLNRAQYNVCIMLMSGEAGTKDLERAKPYCKAAAENGFTEAWERYAVIEATEDNFILSFELASKGVEGKDLDAAEHVGHLATWLLSQPDLMQQPKLRQAIKSTCEPAARLGDTQCPGVLAVVDPASQQEAYTWYLVAKARTGTALPVKALKIKRSLTATQRKAAKAAADMLIANTPSQSEHCNSCTDAKFGKQ